MWHRSCRPFGGLPSELLFSRLLAGLWRGRWCSELSTLSCGLSGGPLVTLRCHCRLLLLDGWSRKGASHPGVSRTAVIVWESVATFPRVHRFVAPLEVADTHCSRACPLPDQHAVGRYGGDLLVGAIN